LSILLTLFGVILAPIGWILLIWFIAMISQAAYEISNEKSRFAVIAGFTSFAVIFISLISAYHYANFSLILLSLFFIVYFFTIIYLIFIRGKKNIKKIFNKAERGEEESIEELISLVINKTGEHKYAAKLLFKLNSQKSINLLCKRWAETRNNRI
jgi:hypothetical protein